MVVGVAIESARGLPELAIEASAAPLLILALQGGAQRIVHANPALERMTGHAAERIHGCDWRILLADPGGDSAVQRLRAAIDAGREERSEILCARRDGGALRVEMVVSPVRDGGGPVTHCVAVLRDLSAEVRLREQLEHSAHHDPLTGLPNRHLLQLRLEQALARTGADATSFGVAYLDLDCFKRINDRLGHAAGDEVLRCIGRRITGAVRPGDTVARVGGDEFVLLLQDVQGSEAIERVVARVLGSLRQPMMIDGQALVVSCCIGLRRCPEDGRDAQTLLRLADLAMYEHKRRQRPDYCAGAHPPVTAWRRLAQRWLQPFVFR